MPNKSVAVCIVNYNSYRDTIACVGSLLLPSDAEVSIVVLDNCSTNESVEMIEQHFRQRQVDFFVPNSENNIPQQSKHAVYLLKSDVNGGFSAGNNIAMRWVKKHLGVSHILLLNNDTIVPEGFVDKLLEQYDIRQSKSEHKIALGVTELNYFTKRHNHSGFQYLNLLTGLAFGKPIPPYFKYICGACLLVDKDAPLMDEGYFLYFDDVEYAKILRKNNYKLYSANNIYYLHKVSATTSQMQSTLQIQFTSMWRFFNKHYPLCLPIVFLMRRLQYFLRRERDKNNVLTDTFKNQVV